MADVLRRAEVSRRLMRALRVPQHEHGERSREHIIVVLGDDSIGWVQGRVAAAGGHARVAAEWQGDLVMLTWATMPPSETPIFDLVEQQSVGPDAPVAMLLDLIGLAPDARHVIRVERSVSVQVSDAERLLAPA